MRIIDNQSYYASSSPIFLKLNILKVEDIYKLQIVLMMYKINNNMWFGNLNCLKVKSVHNYNTRQSASENFYRPPIATNTSKYCSDFMGPLLWSTIPYDLKKLPLHLFKKKYKDELINAY